MEEEKDWSLHDLVRSMGLNRTYVGYQYLIYSLELIREEPERLEMVTKRIYPDVARQFKTSTPNVDGALRTAARACWQRGAWIPDNREGRKDRPPTVSTFLRRLAELDWQSRQ